MEKWEEGFYITAMAGSATGSSLVVMSKGTPYTQQSYKVSDSFPFKWINKKWKEGFYVTSMATSRTRWAVVMSRNAGFIDQCVELDFQYPSEGIHRRWDAGPPLSRSARPADRRTYHSLRVPLQNLSGNCILASLAEAAPLDVVFRRLQGSGSRRAPPRRTRRPLC